MHTHYQRIEGGFSLIELMIAMVISLIVMGLGTSLLAAAFKTRSRADRKSDGIADVQRALNSMTREISNSGFKLPSGLAGVASNGIVTGDSNSQSVRIVSNLNGMPDPSNPTISNTVVTDPDEDVKYLMYVDDVLGQRYIVRYDNNAATKTTVLANRIDSFIIRYFDQKVTYDTFVDSVTGFPDITNLSRAEVSPAVAKYIVIAVGVTLPAVGSPGDDGYQPPSRVQLTSDVVLRNAIFY
jgi:prepilin-type N-terminal cleavage/methylation domain-containing protein